MLILEQGNRSSKSAVMPKVWGESRHDCSRILRRGAFYSSRMSFERVKIVTDVRHSFVKLSRMRETMLFWECHLYVFDVATEHVK